MKKELPTAKEMESFSRQFCNAEWQELTKDKDFRDALCENINKARLLANKILEKEWDN